MRHLSRYSVFVVLGLAFLAPMVFATHEIGDGSGGGATCHSDNISDAHPSAGNVDSYLSSSQAGDPVFQNAPFPIARCSGATSGGCLSRDSFNGRVPKDGATTGKRVAHSRQEYAPTLYITDVDVDVTTAKKKGSGQNEKWGFDPSDFLVLATYSANCHDRVTTPTSTTTSSVTPPHEVGYVADDVFTTEVSFLCNVSVVGAQYTYTYRVINNIDEEISFEWPAVRTGDYPTGWSGVVDANDETEYVYTGTGPAKLVQSHPTDITLTGSTPYLVYRGHSASAYSPSSYVTVPTQVTNLAGSYANGAVTLTWTNSGSYDMVQVLRQGVGTTEAHSWRIPGSSLTFLDLDPPSGQVEYTVVAVVDDVGSENSPDVTVSVP